MWLVAVAALRNIFSIRRGMRHIAVWTLLVAVLPHIVGRRSDEFIERPVTRQASVL